MRIRVDIETRSRVDLKRTGVYRYAACPDFRILMAAWSERGEPASITLGHKANVDRMLDHIVSGDTLVAHNANFERICFSAAYGMPVGKYLDPEQWHCTQAVAGQRGLPSSLSMVAKALKCTPKDEAGAALIRFFCMPISTGARKGEFHSPEDDPEKWEAFCRYCQQDTDTLCEIDNKMGYGHITETERRVYVADQRINDNGMVVDLDLARAAQIVAERNAIKQKARMTELSGIENPKSVQQVRAWLASQIGKDGKPLTTKNLRAETVQALLDSGNLFPGQERVLLLRQELALAAPAKFGTALASVGTDGRLRGSLKVWGAHTGRWAGRGTQPHNLPRLAFTDKVDLLGDGNEVTVKGLGVKEETAAINSVLLDQDVSTETLKKLVRPMFTGPYTIVDYKSIEAVVIAWLSGEDWVLKAIRAQRDIYVETANRMGGLTRQQGKVAVLALGYQGGVNSLRAMAGDINALVNTPVQNRPTVFDPDKKALVKIAPRAMTREEEDKELLKLVIQWRRANPKTARLWGLLQNAIGDGGMAGPRLRVTHSPGTRSNCRNAHLRLPSGRSITYRNLGWERYTTKDPVTEKIVRKEGWRFDSGQGYRAGTYGGRLAENATQAVARDLLAEALVRLQNRGYRIAAHVHDEVLIEGEHDVDLITKIMCELPAWASGMPVFGDGAVVQRYRKI